MGAALLFLSFISGKEGLFVLVTLATMYKDRIGHEGLRTMPPSPHCFQNTTEQC